MKFINIPVQLWNDREHKWEFHPRVFNPQHIVSLEPNYEGDGLIRGTLETVGGQRHVVHPEKYHETLAMLRGEGEVV